MKPSFLQNEFLAWAVIGQKRLEHFALCVERCAFYLRAGLPKRRR